MTRSAYCVRADRGRYAQAFKAGGYAAIGWHETGDLSEISRGDQVALAAAYDAAFSGEESGRRGRNLGQIRKFLWEIEPGDVVVTPMEESRYLLVGIAGDSYYHESTPDCPYPHRREVHWLEEPVPRSSLPVPIQNALRAWLTVFEVRPPDSLLRAAGQHPPTLEPVQRTEADVSTLVLERLLDLDADEFEILVTELLTAIGFEAEKTGKTGDRGVDVEGVLDVYGFARMELSVQVKRYKLGSTVDHHAIQDFRASVPDQEAAAFVTTGGYTERAREEAEREGFKRIGLIDGQQLVDILAEEYERLPEELRGKLGLRRALVAG